MSANELQSLIRERDELAAQLQQTCRDFIEYRQNADFAARLLAYSVRKSAILLGGEKTTDAGSCAE